MKTRSLFIIWLFASTFPDGLGQEKLVTLHIQFAADPGTDWELVPAVLKYNKDFAFSFTFDDTYKDSYTLGFKLLGGGFSPVDGITYPGLFYSDGCGTLIPFTAGLAWVSANAENKDLHTGNPDMLSYQDARDMHAAGWDFFNHSYSHLTITDSATTLWQLTENSRILKANTGISMLYCIPPSGDDTYIPVAFSSGLLACFTSRLNSTTTGLVTDVTNPVHTPDPVYYRSLLNSDTDSLLSMKSQIDQQIAISGQGRQKWWNEFTHRIDYMHVAASVRFPVFRGYFEYLENQYGSKGRDNGWFASSAEVFEYLLVRDKMKIRVSQTGGVADVVLDFSEVPDNLRYYDVSLLVNSPIRIQQVTSQQPIRITHAETSGRNLININVPDNYFMGTEPIPQDNRLLISGYPNPVSGRYFIPLPFGLEHIGVRITDILANEMPAPTVVINNRLMSIDFDSSVYPSGVYFVNVYSGTRRAGICKVLIQR